VLERVAKDERFRNALLTNPRAVLGREYHLHVPETVSILVIEDTAQTLTITLPPKREAMQELTDAELEGISGGWGDLFNFDGILGDKY
jgi:hypothetical protein